MFSIILFLDSPYTDSTGKGFFYTYKYGILNFLLTSVGIVFIFGVYKKINIVMKPRKNKYYQCTHCGYIVTEKESRCRRHKCNGAVLPYKDLLGIGAPKLKDGAVFLK